jgi:hypothetical protein
LNNLNSTSDYVGVVAAFTSLTEYRTIRTFPHICPAL